MNEREGIVKRINIVHFGTVIGSAETDAFGGIGNVQVDPNYIDQIVPGTVLSDNLTIEDVGEAIQQFLFIDKEIQVAYLRFKSS